MTLRDALIRALGLAAIAALGYGLFLAWGAWRDIVSVLPQPWRGFANQTRFVIEILAAFLALSVADWLWRQTIGRLGSH